MKAVFIETSEVTEWVCEYLPDDVYGALQLELMANPEKGDVIRGCGGLRKLRVADPKRQKGKRGGARIIYVYIPEARWFYMLDIYGKDEKDDLSNEEKQCLAELIDEFRAQAIASVNRAIPARRKGKTS